MSNNRLKKTKSDLEEENSKLKDQIKFQWADRITGIITTIIPWGVIAYGIHETGAIATEIAGTNTKFDFTVSASIGLTISGLLNFYQFIERGRVKKELSVQLDDCKKTLDPGKQTSGLRSDGSTHPGDKP